MVVPQRHAPIAPALVPAPIVAAAGRYQRMREVELAQLAIMRRQPLLDEWTDDVRAIVLEARARIQAARAARTAFRDQVSAFVRGRRDAREPLSLVLRQTRALLQALEQSGTLAPEDGELEAEVLEWAIEEYETAA